MDHTKLMLEAIALRKCIDATYNRSRFRLAPHILYSRHGELYMDAVTITCDDRAPRETKLGTFKLAGMADVDFSGEDFIPNGIFDPTDEKYAGNTLFAVELDNGAPISG
jgi:hypothetical protein